MTDQECLMQIIQSLGLTLKAAGGERRGPLDNEWTYASEWDIVRDGVSDESGVYIQIGCGIGHEPAFMGFEFDLSGKCVFHYGGY